MVERKEKAMENVFMSKNNKASGDFGLNWAKSIYENRNKRINDEEELKKKNMRVKRVSIRDKKQKDKSALQDIIDKLLALRNKTKENMLGIISKLSKEDEVGTEISGFLQSLAIAKTEKNRVIKLSSLLGNKTLNCYVFSEGLINKPVFCNDKLLWVYEFREACKSAVKEIKEKNKDFVECFEEYVPCNDLLSVKIMSKESFKIVTGTTSGYFEDYDPLLYAADIFYLKNEKSYDLSALFKNVTEKFTYLGTEYNVYIDDKYNNKDIGWKVVTVINTAQAAKVVDKINTSRFLHFERDKSVKNNILASGLKKVYGQNKYYYIYSDFTPLMFCPSVLIFKDQNIVCDVLFKASIDLDYFLAKCVEKKKLNFPPNTITFSNLDLVYRICFVYIMSIDDSNLTKDLRDILDIYSRYRQIFIQAAKVYKSFKKLVLNFIDNVSSNKFIFKNFTKMYKKCPEIIGEYEKLLLIFSENSEEMKVIKYFGNSSISMYNFFDANVLNTIKAINSVCYQVHNCISNELDLALRSAGALCFTNLMDGSLCTIYEIRPRSGFLGGLENSEDDTLVIQKIEELINTKKFMQEATIKNLETGFEEFENINDLFRVLIKKRINKVLEEKNKKLDVDLIFNILNTDNSIKSSIVREYKEYMKDKEIEMLHKAYNVLEDITLPMAIKKYIEEIVDAANSNNDLKIENGDIKVMESEKVVDALDKLYNVLLEENNINSTARSKRIEKNIANIKEKKKNYENKNKKMRRRMYIGKSLKYNKKEEEEEKKKKEMEDARQDDDIKNVDKPSEEQGNIESTVSQSQI